MDFFTGAHQKGPGFRPASTTWVQEKSKKVNASSRDTGHVRLSRAKGCANAGLTANPQNALMARKLQFYLFLTLFTLDFSPFKPVIYGDFVIKRHGSLLHATCELKLPY